MPASVASSGAISSSHQVPGMTITHIDSTLRRPVAVFELRHYCRVSIDSAAYRQCQPPEMMMCFEQMILP